MLIKQKLNQDKNPLYLTKIFDKFLNKNMLQDNSNHFINSFNLLTKDYLLIHEYIDPSDSNLHTYSHRNYELLLRLCTEFENLCKEKIIEKDAPNKKKNLKSMILDYWGQSWIIGVSHHYGINGD